MKTMAARMEITNTCQCYHCPACDVGLIGTYENGQCPDCSNELQSDSYCSGMCWEDTNYLGSQLFDDYMKSVDNPKHLRIEGRAMGWQRRNGWKDIPATWENLRDSLSIDGEWTLRIEVDSEGIFTVFRYSHDEPTGARFSVYPIKHIPDSMDLDDAIKLEIVDEYGCHKGCGEYFYDCQCESEGER